MEQTSKGFTITDLQTNQAQDLSLSDFSYEHNSLIEVVEGGVSTKLQLLSSSNDLAFDFYFRGNKVQTHVFDEAQFKYKHFMKVPEKLDTAKMVMSPMPGAIVSIAV